MKLILVVLWIFNSSYAFGSVTDSIKILLSNLTTEDSIKVRLLADLALQLSTSNPDEGISYVQMSKELAKKNKDKLAEGRAYSILGKIYSIKSMYDSSLTYYKLALSIHTQLNISKQISSDWNGLGIVYIQQSDYENSLAAFRKSLSIQESLGNKKGIATSLTNIGVIYKKTSSYSAAFETYLRALKISEEIGEELISAVCNNNIGLIYVELNEYDKALRYYNKSLIYYEKINDKNNLARSYLNIGSLYDEMAKYDSAITYLNQSLQIARELRSAEAISNANTALGMTFSKRGDYTKADMYLSPAMKIAQEINNKENIILIYTQLGTNLTKQKRYDQALYYLNQAQKLAKEVKDKSLQLKNYKALYEIYSLLNDSPNALKYYVLYIDLKDSVFTKEKLDELRIRYETEGKEKEIELLKKDKYLVELERDRQGTLIILFITITALLALLIFFGVYRIRIKTRVNKRISEINKQLENQNALLEEQSEKLKELDEVKSRFFSSISHEFRTPLTLIIGPLEQLLSEVKDDSLRNQYKMMLRNAYLQLNLVNQLLDLSRIEKGKMRLTASKNNLAKSLKIMVSSFDSLARQKGIELRCDFKDADLEIYFDTQKLQTIINNLLLNALKFTEIGGVVEVNAGKSENGFAVIKVKDSGIGIQESELEHIFEHFYQADNLKGKNYGGTGLGLAITKELVELHKGKIEVNSKLGQGTEFIINLPLGNSHLVPKEIIEESEEMKIVPLPYLIEQETPDKIRIKTDSTSRILVVEDNPDMKTYICKSIYRNYRLVEAENGIDGFQKAKKHLPDLIISDVMMPFMDGFELTEKLKQDTLTSHIPIILLTARVGEESKINGLNIGADDYINKPFSLNELNARISNLIKNRQQLREKFQKQINIDIAEVTSSSLDEAFLSKVVTIIEKNIENANFGVEELCSEIAMSQSNLFRKIKALTGLSITHFIRTIRIKKAAQLLKNKTENVTEVMYQVGFNSISYFAKCFKEQFGILPSEFK